MIRLRCITCGAVYSASEGHVCRHHPAVEEYAVKVRGLGSLIPTEGTLPTDRPGFDRTAYQREYMRQYRAKKASSEVKAAVERLAALPEPKAKYDRNAAHREYMRDYMRKRRGSKLAKGGPK